MPPAAVRTEMSIVCKPRRGTAPQDVVVTSARDDGSDQTVTGKRMAKRGFTLIEVIIGSALLAVVAGVGIGMVLTGQKAFTSSSNQMYASTRASSVMERILCELRMASIRGEDVDDDDDTGDLTKEDLNGNGRIDDDWSLADGETSSVISFNIVDGVGNYSDRITFRYAGGRLVRELGSTNPVVSLLADDVTALTFTRQGERIIVNVVVESGVVAQSEEDYDRGGRQVSLVREILIRN